MSVAITANFCTTPQTTPNTDEERAIQMPGVCGFTRGHVAWGHECACEHSKFGGDAISSCNVTGRWAEEDEDVQKACEEWDRSRGAFVREGWQLYSNAFCAMCNEDVEVSIYQGLNFDTVECTGNTQYIQNVLNILPLT